MFAHIVTAQAEAEGFDRLTSSVRGQLPEIPQQPGFRRFYFLRDPESTKLITISLWETKQDPQASLARAAGRAAPVAALTAMRVDTYEGTMSA